MIAPPASVSLLSPASRAGGYERRTARQAARDRVKTPVLPEELFHDVLVRERNRADRFDERFLLLLVSFSSLTGARRAHVLATVVEALRACTDKPHVIGWFRGRRVLGVIVPEAGVGSSTTCDELLRRVRSELAGRLDTALLPLLPIRVCVEAGSDANRVPTMLPVDDGLRAEAGTLVRDAAKRILDVAGSIGLLVATSPVLLLVAAAVKLTSPGPILFRQERVGHAGRPFTMLKFRTMHVHADKAIHQQYVTQFIRANAAANGPGSQTPFKIVNDPRITRVGRFLRRTSLDELPQFWNVLRGEMSLVGPRPPLPYEVAQYRHWHHRRVREAKPGITGLWQVAGRSRTTFDEMVRLDLHYARTRSLWTDIKILVATPRAVISGKGAC